MRGTVGLSEIYKEYHEDINFLNIYIREAHAKDGWWFGRGLPKILFKMMGVGAATHLDDPKTIEERRAAAGECEEALAYGVQTVVDEMDDAVNEAYAAWPTRLYLIGLDGRVIYHGGVGPYDFHPKHLKTAIETYLNN